ADRLAVDPGTDEIGTRSGVARLAIYLVGHRFGEHEAVELLVNQIQHAHTGEQVILVEANFPPGLAWRDLNKIEYLRRAGRGIDIDEGGIAARSAPGLAEEVTQRRAEGIAALRGVHLGEADVDDVALRNFSLRKRGVHIRRQ